MVSARLVESGQFVVLERPDLDRIEKERVISGTDSELVGVDTLIVGSLTEFGRNITGRSGFLSSTKKQTAVAKVEVRLVNVKTGQAYFLSHWFRGSHCGGRCRIRVWCKGRL